MDFLKMLRNWKDVEEYPAQTVIFEEGNPADVLYIIISGRVELSLRGESLGVEEAGGIVGEMAISLSATRSSTVTSLTDVKLARLDRDQLGKLMRENTEFSLHLMAVLANRLRAVNHYITVQMGPA